MPMKGQIELRKEIADRLKHAREAAGYQTAEEFCKKYAIGLKKYVKHEEGESAIRASDAYLYSRCLEVSLFWLMLGNEE